MTLALQEPLPAPPGVLPPGWAWRLHPPQDPARGAVEAFVRSIYAQRHQAQVRAFAPQLVSLWHQGELVAAAGYRSGLQALFLERYLDAPVQQLVSRQTGLAVDRRRLVEVGHLAASQAGAGRRLIHVLGGHLSSLGVEWVVGTLTQELYHLFLRMGVQPLTLAVADPGRLGADAGDWGRYYTHQPRVLAGRLPDALPHLSTVRRAAVMRAVAS